MRHIWDASRVALRQIGHFEQETYYAPADLGDVLVDPRDLARSRLRAAGRGSPEETAGDLLDKGRPAALEAKSGSGYVLITFKRTKP